MGHETVSPRTRLLAGSLSGFGTKRIIAGVAAVMAAGAIPVANAEIELGEGLSVSGFLDMSLTSTKVDGAPTTKSLGIDQFETDFMFAGSNGISAQVDIEFDTGTGTQSNNTFVEQAFVTKSFNDMFSMKFGRFLSYSGWETEEPTGLFQYSGAGSFSNGSNYYQANFYGGYQQGVSASYNAGMFSIMGSVVTDALGSASDPPNGLDRDWEELGYELGVAVQPMEGLTAKLFYILNEGATDDDTIINAWVSYAVSGFTFAGEFGTREFASGAADVDGLLLMANYATGPWGVTARYNQTKFPGATVSAITLSPSYKMTDKLLLVAEYRMDDYDGPDGSSFALEALLTF